MIRVYTFRQMAKISDEEIGHLAELSNITLSEAEAKSLRGDLEGILKYVGMLDELDTDGVEPTYQIGGLKNVWREDEIIEYPVDKEGLLALAKESEDGQIKVPKVL